MKKYILVISVVVLATLTGLYTLADNIFDEKGEVKESVSEVLEPTLEIPPRVVSVGRLSQIETDTLKNIQSEFERIRKELDSKFEVKKQEFADENSQQILEFKEILSQRDNFVAGVASQRDLKLACFAPLLSEEDKVTCGNDAWMITAEGAIHTLE